MTSCNSLYLALLVVNWLKEARRDHFGLIVGSSGYQKPSIFIERVIIFKHFVVFASSASLDQENHPKRSPRNPQSLQKHPAEDPRNALERPGGVHGDPPNHPKSDPGRKASGSDFGSPWASFSSVPNLMFYLCSPIFFSDSLFCPVFPENPMPATFGAGGRGGA